MAAALSAVIVLGAVLDRNARGLSISQASSVVSVAVGRKPRPESRRAARSGDKLMSAEYPQVNLVLDTGGTLAQVRGCLAIIRKTC
jgi:hypothetical protein